MALQIEFTDEQLTAYLDGEFEYCPKQEIEAGLAINVELQTRLAALDFDQGAMLNAMNILANTAPPAPDLSNEFSKPVQEIKPTGRFGFPNGLMAASVALVMLGIGAFSGFIANQEDQHDWQDYVAFYQVLYVEDTLQHVDFDVGVAETELQRVSAAIEKPLKLAALRSVEELDYKRAQILGFEDKPLAQMTFLTPQGVPIAFCIVHNNTDKTRSVSTRELENLASASWAQEGYEFMVIGGDDQAFVEQIAKEFKALL